MKYLINETNKIPQLISGLYFVFQNELLIYIGKSFNIRTRFKNHQLKLGTHVIIIPICHIENDLDQIEREVIKFFNPILNTRFTTWRNNTNWRYKHKI